MWCTWVQTPSLSCFVIYSGIQKSHTCNKSTAYCRKPKISHTIKTSKISFSVRFRLGALIKFDPPIYFPALPVNKQNSIYGVHLKFCVRKFLCETSFSVEFRFSALIRFDPALYFTTWSVNKQNSIYPVHLKFCVRKFLGETSFSVQCRFAVLIKFDPALYFMLNRYKLTSKKSLKVCALFVVLWNSTAEGLSSI